MIPAADPTRRPWVYGAMEATRRGLESQIADCVRTLSYGMPRGGGPWCCFTGDRAARAVPSAGAPGACGGGQGAQRLQGGGVLAAGTHPPPSALSLHHHHGADTRRHSGFHQRATILAAVLVHTISDATALATRDWYPASPRLAPPVDVLSRPGSPSPACSSLSH